MERWSRSVLVFTLVLPWAEVARGNMAPYFEVTEAIGEPAGASDSVSVSEETLTLDLRPLAERPPGQPRVAASYRLLNDGAAVELDLVFFASRINEGVINLDQVRLEPQSIKGASPPTGWNPPTDTLSLDGSGQRVPVNYPEDLVRASAARGIPATRRGTPGWGVHLVVPPGRHDLAVSYPVPPSGYSDSTPYGVRQIGYVLTPARGWKSYGTLQVRVLAPAEWVMESSLSLKKEGSGLSGTFVSLPAESFTVSTRRSIGSLQLALVMYYLPLLGPIVGLLTGLLLSRAAAKDVARRVSAGARPGGWVGGYGLLVGVLSYGACFVVGLLGLYSTILLVDYGQASQSWVFGYGLGSIVLAAYGGIAVGLVSLLSLPVLVGIQEWRAPRPPAPARRKRRKKKARAPVEPSSPPVGNDAEAPPAK